MMDQLSAASRPAVMSDLARTLVSRKVGSMPSMSMGGPKLRQPRIRVGGSNQPKIKPLAHGFRQF